MTLVLFLKSVSPRFCPAIEGQLNEEVVQLFPQYLPTPSPVNFENNQPNKKDKIRLELKSISHNSSIHPQESDSDGPKPTSKKLLIPTADIRVFDQFNAEEEEAKEEELRDGFEKGKETGN
ncbi:hypothetical protein O181_043058 [Austropuccinia psidii MF-1]|uniref:Uncharacterized protein n=1 Tax=Austropuccinia psidii MF-1 TaxID=1389203 RepID=A0A9Q3DKJ9_9BASI|nr:hypothetical protein [Austropuccinia psidii MF-1]